MASKYMTVGEDVTSSLQKTRLIFVFFQFTAVCISLVYRYVHKLDQQTLKYRRPERMSFLNSVVFEKEDQNADPNDNPNDDNDGEQSAVMFSIPSAVAKTEIESSDEGNHRCDDAKHQLTTTDLRNSENSLHAPHLGHDKTNASGTALEEAASKNDGIHEISNGSDASEGPGENEDTTGDMPQSILRKTPTDHQSERRRSSKLKDGMSVQQLVSNWKASRTRYQEDYQRTLEVFHQSCFYLGVFYLTHIWSTTNRILQLVNNGSSNYAVTVIHAM
jgi:hypothetical protein